MVTRLIVAVALALTACAEPCEPVPPGQVGELTAWERRFLAEGGLPEVPSYGRVVAEDDLALAYTDWVPDDWTGDGPVLLFVHGSSAHGALYAVLGQGLAQNGVYARVIDLRGHGHSRCAAPGSCDPLQPPTYEDDGRTWPGRPGDSADVNQHLRDLQVHLADLAKRVPGQTPILAGHSSGAGLVARYIEHVGMSHLKGAVLLAPFLHPDQPQNELDAWECGRVVGTSYARVDLGALGDARRGNPHRYVLSLDKPEALTDSLDTLRYTKTTMQGLAVSDPVGAFAAFTRPTLWMAADQDALLDLETSYSEYERLPAGAGFITVRNTSHVGITWSAEVARRIAQFAFEPDAAVAPGTVLDP